MRLLIITLLVLLPLTPAQASETIKIGGIFSYTGLPHHVERAQNAALLAVEEQNAQGGLLGKKIELTIRDDRAQASDAIQVAQELLFNQNVSVLTGTSFSHVSVALSGFAEKNKVPYFATWCTSHKCNWSSYNPYLFPIDENSTVGARVLADYAKDLPQTKWGIVGYAMEWGTSVAEDFKTELTKHRNDVEFVSENFEPWGKVKAANMVQSLRRSEAEAVHIALSGKDLIAYLREARARGFLEEVPHLHPFLPTEEIEYIGSELPEEWIILSYPDNQLETPENMAFINAYKKKYNQNPSMAGLLSYINTRFVLAAIKKAGVAESEAITQAAYGLEIDTPVGKTSLRDIDNRSTFTMWLGETAIEDGKPIIRNFKRNDLQKYMLSDEEITAMQGEK